MRVARIEALDGGPANLSQYVDLYNPAVDGLETGRNVALGGFGRGRGDSLTDSGITYGYSWDNSGNATQRWGSNQVDAIQTGFQDAMPWVSDILVDDFDSPTTKGVTLNEAALGRFDSGGGWFIKVGSRWKLAGINAYTEMDGASRFADIPSTDVIEAPEQNGAIRVAAYTDFISATAGLSKVASVRGRHVFYNNSRFTPAAAASATGVGSVPALLGDIALATDKTPLLPGQTATFANYTGYSRGINGIAIDVDNLQGLPTAADFQFKLGNDDHPENWQTLNVQPQIVVQPGAGEGGSDRILLTWPDHTIEKDWLEVTLAATPVTGLSTPDVFYFGNAIGESGSSGANALVNASDEIGARNNPRNILNPAPIDFAYDFNRDGLVNAADQILARNNGTTFLNSLRLIAIASAGIASVAVPEPSILILASMALGGLMGFGRRFSRRRA
jgi:hypothetical protein